MEIKKYKICVVSSKDQCDKTLIHEYIRDLKLNASYALENSRPLPEIYNNAIEMALVDDCDCLILVHDDVILEENPIPKLEKLFDQFDLVGVAGTSKIELKSPALWHLMGGGFNGGNLHGKVQHLHKEIISYMPLLEREIKPLSDFGSIPKQVVMIDGVFMALNRKAMETMRFDENNPCKFHFYDLSFSLDCHLNGCKVGVGDILITHASPGLREFTEDWKNGEKWFINKYDKE